jgi:hypothetical protein
VRNHDWNPNLHPRDGDGKFSTSPGGGSDVSKAADHAIRKATGRAHDTPTVVSTKQGMPDTLAEASVPLAGGGSLKLDHRADGNVSIGVGDRSTTLSKDSAGKLFSELSLAADWDPGEGYDVPGVGHLARTGRNSYQAKLNDGTTLDFAQGDIKQAGAALDRFDAATRIETEYGDYDVVPSGKKLALRHLGDDGRPIEIQLDKGSYLRINTAIDDIIDAMDFPEEGRPPVTRKIVNTNQGKVRVEIVGQWRGGTYNDRLEIAPASGDAWGIVVDGKGQDAFVGALGDVADAFGWR